MGLIATIWCVFFGCALLWGPPWFRQGVKAVLLILSGAVLFPVRLALRFVIRWFKWCWSHKVFSVVYFGLLLLFGEQQVFHELNFWAVTVITWCVMYMFWDIGWGARERETKAAQLRAKEAAKLAHAVTQDEPPGLG